MYSSRTLLPIDHYRLPFCQQLEGPKLDKTNLGELLVGDRIESSPYILRMKKDMYCEHLCSSFLGPRTTNRMAKAIRDAYHTNWLVDNLPAASKVEDDYRVTTRYWKGFPVGFINESDMKAYIHNHVNIEIFYQKNYMEPDKYRIVQFLVQPFSIQHEVSLVQEEKPDNIEFYLPRRHRIENPIASCDPRTRAYHTNYDMIVDPSQKAQEAYGEVLFTYDVIWRENTAVPWAHRWDIYLTMDDAIPTTVHWFSIVNSLVYSFALSALVVVLLLRNVRSNIDEEINDADQTQESLNDKGYELIHVDYFRPPDHRVCLLAVFCGTGAQLLASFVITIVAAVVGFLHMSDPGRFVLIGLFAFDLCGFVNGFFTFQIMKLFKASQDWSYGGLFASIFFPSVTLVLFLCQQFIAIARHSTLAVPISAILYLLALWLGILVPSTFLGAYAGNSVRSMCLPTSPRTVLLGIASYRSIRNGDNLTKCLCVMFCLLFNFGWLVIGVLWLVRSWLVKKSCWRPDFNGVVSLLVGGVFCFGSIYVELFFILASLWLKYYYATFGFLLVVAVIFFWTCGVVSVLFNYVHLTVEACHSWWWQFLCSGAAGIWIALYSFLFAPHLQLSSFPSALLYFGFMAWMSFAVFLMAGCVGFLCSFLFIRTIFSIGTAGTTMLEQGQGIALGEITADSTSADNDEPETSSTGPLPELA
jgi:transmembrane 9 superfamily member 2/4